MRRGYEHLSAYSNPGEGDAAGGIGNESAGWGRTVQERNVRSRSGSGWGMRIDTFEMNQHVVVRENGSFQLHGKIMYHDSWQLFYHVKIMDGSGAIRKFCHDDIRHIEDMAAGFGN